MYDAEHWTEIVSVVFEWNCLVSLWLLLNANYLACSCLKALKASVDRLAWAKFIFYCFYISFCCVPEYKE